VNDNIALDDFFFVFLDLFFVHGLDLVVPLKIGLLKVFELSLKFFELPGDAFVLSCEVFVLFLE
jgi:hypothetical protein